MDSAERCSMFSRILVPLDGSRIAEGILPYVTQFAKRLNAGVVLHTAVDPDSIHLPTTYPSQQDTRAENSGASNPPMEGRRVDADPATISRSQLEAGILGDVRSDLEEVARRLAAEGIEADVVATIGRPDEQILTTAEAEACNLIALATHGRNAIARGLLGSVTDRVVHLSTLPVLTVSPGRDSQELSGSGQIHNMIVPLDGSELGETVLPEVEDLAGAMGLQVHLVHAFDPVEYDRRHRYMLTLAGVPGASASRQLKAHHKAYLESVAVPLAGRGLDVKTEVLTGQTALAIVEYARESSREIVVMATHGRSGFRRLLLGSVTEALVRSSHAPVLIIPPRASQ